MAMLFAMTIPGLAVALVLLAAVDRLLLRRRGRRLLGGASPDTAGATGVDEFSALIYTGKRMERDTRAAAMLLRDDVGNGDPLRIDPVTGRARIRVAPAR